jgi:hypothetical protein
MNMPITQNDRMALTFEQHMASYRQRIRAKLYSRGLRDDDLDRETEELMQRPTGGFSDIFEQ